MPSTVRKFRAEEVAALLKAADAHLSRPARVVVIGGMAIGLHSDARYATSDLDVLSGTEAVVLEALQRAQVEMGLLVPIQPVGVYSAPYDFEDRLQRIPIEGLVHLDARVPEAHDLALMKIARGRTHDLDAIETLHAHHPLRLKTLMERFKDTTVEGSRTDFEISFILTVERLYGTPQAEEVERIFQQDRDQPGS